MENGKKKKKGKRRNFWFVRKTENVGSYGKDNEALMLQLPVQLFWNLTASDRDFLASLISSDIIVSSL